MHLIAHSVILFLVKCTSFNKRFYKICFNKNLFLLLCTTSFRFTCTSNTSFYLDSCYEIVKIATATSIMQCDSSNVSDHLERDYGREFLYLFKTTKYIPASNLPNRINFAFLQVQEDKGERVHLCGTSKT